MYLCLSSKSVESDIPLKLKPESVSQEDLITKKLYKITQYLKENFLIILLN